VQFFLNYILFVCLVLFLWEKQIMRFFTNPHKPMILALARPDPKKNITTLLKAFGECAPLRELANLVNPNFPPLSIRPPIAVLRTEGGATS